MSSKKAELIFFYILIIFAGLINAVAAAPCAIVYQSDFNNDCVVDFNDFSRLAQDWLKSADYSNNSSLVNQNYPIGFLDVYPSQDNFSYLKSIGVNYVHRYYQGNSLEPTDIQRDMDYLNLAQQNDLKVFFHLYGQKWINETDGLSNMQTLINQFKSHTALGMWQIYDEPDSGSTQNTPSEIQPFYNMLKQEAPDVPTSIIFAWTNTWFTYQNCVDIFMLDYYTVMDQEPNQASLLYTPRFVGKMKGMGKPAIPIIQAFNYACFYPGQETVVLKGEERNVADLRYPTAYEMRYLCYSSLAQDADGLFFYSWYRSTQLGDQWAKQEFAPILVEVREFAEEAVVPGSIQLYHDTSDNQTVWFSNSQADTIFFTKFDTVDESYLIMTNNSSSYVDINRYFEQLAGKTYNLLPWGSTRNNNPVFVNGNLICSAHPWEVFIWKIR